MTDTTIISLVVFIVLAVFWCRQFVELMLLSDADFPGKHDKILWVFAFLVGFLVVPFAFVFWKQGYLVVRKAERDTKDK
jgi:hypothetical protein